MENNITQITHSVARIIRHIGRTKCLLSQKVQELRGGMSILGKEVQISYAKEQKVK